MRRGALAGTGSPMGPLRETLADLVWLFNDLQKEAHGPVADPSGAYRKFV